MNIEDRDKLSLEVENYLIDIVDTSLKYIPQQLKGEYIKSIHSITVFHKESIQRIVNSK